MLIVKYESREPCEPHVVEAHALAYLSQLELLKQQLLEVSVENEGLTAEVARLQRALEEAEDSAELLQVGLKVGCFRLLWWYIELVRNPSREVEGAMSCRQQRLYVLPAYAAFTLPSRSCVLL